MSEKKEFAVLNKILNFHIIRVYRLKSRKSAITSGDIKKFLSFYSYVKRHQCLLGIREIFFNAFLSFVINTDSRRLQKKLSKTIPFLLQSLGPSGKITRAQSIIWKIIHALVNKNKSNMIIFRQNKGLYFMKKFIAMGQDNSSKRSPKTIQCIKAVKRQLIQINNFISLETILEARKKLKKEENLLRNQIISQSIALETHKATALEKNVLSIFQKTFLSKLPKIFWTK